jgi:chromosome segregation ATPase
MKNFLIIILCIIVLGGLGYYGYQIYKKSPETSKLEEDNIRLKNDIDKIEAERDALKPLIEKIKLQTDSLSDMDSIYKKEIISLKLKNSQLEARLSKSLDSANKYKSIWKNNTNKYKDLKKNQKKPSNQQTLDFFKKY